MSYLVDTLTSCCAASAILQSYTSLYILQNKVHTLEEATRANPISCALVQPVHPIINVMCLVSTSPLYNASHRISSQTRRSLARQSYLLAPWYSQSTLIQM